MGETQDLRGLAMHRAILAIALPSMLTNVATALFGLADMWVIGRLGDPAAQGAVEIGAKLLMTLLIVFNFLRSGTVALTAQAAGRADEAAQSATLARSLAVAAAIGAFLLAAMPLVVPAGLALFSAKGQVAALARTYVQIRYAGGVAWLINAVLTGWLIGRRQVRAVLAVEVGSNLLHISLDAGFVLGLHLGVAGVAFATLSSEAAKLLALATMVSREAPARGFGAVLRRAETWRPVAIGQLLRLNRDLFARTLLLMAATVLLTRTGAQQGPTILAANAILYQLFMLSALLLDGFESSAQVLCGEALGGGRRGEFQRLILAILAWAWGAAALVTLAYALAGARIAASFSTAPAVVAATGLYIGWAVALPATGVTSFVFDGIFIGSSWTRAMLIGMAAALAVFVALLLAARPMGNNGLWLAFNLFFLARAAGQALMTPGLIRRSFAGAATVAPLPQEQPA
ncbi:MATE family efflux transporter [Phenylobacterium montanum]|uniref:MATE family efflux transporter n=1 Tax=Phenylobacterium montanum TaxID=2823693 RepID=A0A975FWY9_9CAUL|nr:MATE family efflux transporter [Caulobacter sp. S6]QUD86484.1 MATE family efflux transporter [Caulobacter sp. S6]